MRGQTENFDCDEIGGHFQQAAQELLLDRAAAMDVRVADINQSYAFATMFIGRHADLLSP